MAETRPELQFETLVSLCKRRGFVFPGSEIYGGISGFWDYGPLGVEMKNNIKRAWWKAMVQDRDDVVGIDAAIVMNPRVWEASGHVATFSDPMVDCRNCKRRFRADHLYVAYVDLRNGSKFAVSSSDGEHSLKRLIDERARAEKSEVKGSLVSPIAGLSPLDTVPCPQCGTLDSFTEPRQFNLMFKTNVGPIDIEGEIEQRLGFLTGAFLDTEGVIPDEQLVRYAREATEALKELLADAKRSRVYLRPETAQAMFVNFENVVTSMRRKLPFGIAQIGRAFRNEITPGNFIFRDREFELMEVEFFVKPGTDEAWQQHWVEERLRWFKELGVREANLRLRPHEKDELSHYAKATYDLEYLYPMGWSELEGIANRTDFDLKKHAEHSGKSLSYFDEETNEHIVPYVIEPAVGVDRTFLVLLYDAYREEEVRGEKRTFLKLHASVAPIKVAVLPLSRNEKLTPLAQEVHALLRPAFMTQYDDAQSIGRRYRRQDEIGTPLCVTVDFESLEDGAVTIRDRDSMAQTRVQVEELAAALREKLGT